MWWVKLKQRVKVPSLKVQISKSGITAYTTFTFFPTHLVQSKPFSFHLARVGGGGGGGGEVTYYKIKHSAGDLPQLPPAFLQHLNLKLT